TVDRDFPSVSHANLVLLIGSSPGNAASITSWASRRSPHSRRAFPSARVLFPRFPVRPSFALVPWRVCPSPGGVFRFRFRPGCGRACVSWAPAPCTTFTDLEVVDLHVAGNG